MTNKVHWCVKYLQFKRCRIEMHQVKTPVNHCPQKFYLSDISSSLMH